MDLAENTIDIISTQTIHPPFDELGLVEAHYKLISQSLQWAGVGILIDQDVGENKAVLITLIEQDRIVATFRICFETAKQILASIRLFLHDEDESIILRAYQGEYFNIEQIRSLESLNALWLLAEEQSIELSESTGIEVIEQIFLKPRVKGRGKDFSVETKRRVSMDAHGRCMFEGCGANLQMDETTGIKGNYGYLAHNVASSAKGPRGIPVVSEELSDDPSNVLLLCDKHHRLVDKIASSDYPAHRLSKMRTDFCKIASRLLDGLSYEPVPAISITWPVQRNVISSPSDLQINQSLSKMNWRMESALLSPCGDNDGVLKNLPPEGIRSLWPELITDTASKVISSIGMNQYRAALFAFGPMPQLIALGAKIGNKQEIIPMLRYRDGNQWTWPADAPQGKRYEILGLSSLSGHEDEIILSLSFTQHPQQFDKFTGDQQLKVVKVKATEFGNGSLGHPIEGINFMADMQSLLHELKDSYGVNKVHLLPCASNAVCVFFGKAFDTNHPELIVYDFNNQTMEPALRILNRDHLCCIESS